MSTLRLFAYSAALVLLGISPTAAEAGAPPPPPPPAPPGGGGATPTPAGGLPPPPPPPAFPGAGGGAGVPGAGVPGAGASGLPSVPEASVTSIADFYAGLKAVAQWVLVFGIIIGVLFVIWGALLVVRSQGDDRKLTEGKATITWAVVGIMLLILSYGLVNLVASFLGSSGPVVSP